VLRELKRLSKQTIIYGVGVILSRAIGFFLIPMYTHFLSPKDYGVLELVDLTGYILSYVLSMGIDQALIRFYHLYQDPRDKSSVLSTAVWFTVIWGGILVGALVPLAPFLSTLLFGTHEYSTILMVALASLFMGSVTGLQRAILRAQQRSVMFTAVALANTGISILLNILFVAVLHVGVLGIVYSGLISATLIGIYLWTRISPDLKAGPDRTKLRPMLRYGIPFVPGGIFAFVLNWSDRFFLRLYSSIAAVGLYGLGYKFGMIVVMLVSVPFTFVWGAYMFEIQSLPTARRTYARVATYFMLGLCAVGLVISVFGRELIVVMADKAYWGAERVIPVVVLGMILMCSDNVFQVGLLLEGKSAYLSVAKGIAAAVNLALNLLLIPRFQTMGAAWATAIAFGVYAASIYYAAQRAYPIEYERVRLIKLGVCALAVFALASFVPTEPLRAAILKKSLILTLFPISLLVLRFPTSGESAYLTRAIRQRLTRPRPSG